MDKPQPSHEDPTSQIILNPIIDIILFANPLSGDARAKEYLAQNILSLHLSDCQVTVFSYNLCDDSSKKEGYSKIKSLLEVHETLKVIALGGDGTLTWLIESLIPQDINLDRVHFGILPFGSGNDLSSYLGWGRAPPDNIYGPYIEEWIRATPRAFNLWTIQIEMTGGLCKIARDSTGYFKEFVEENGNKKLYVEKIFMSHFSIGLHGQHGFGYDKRKSHKSVELNRKILFWGFVRMMLFKKTQSIPEMISSVSCGGEVFVDNSIEEMTLHKDTNILMAMNITPYAATDSDIWNNAKSQKEREWVGQSSQDGVIELIGLYSKLAIVLEFVRSKTRKTRKIHQGYGPFRFNFKETCRKCYVLLDGEYFLIYNPRFITMNRCEKYRDVNVLYRA